MAKQKVRFSVEGLYCKHCADHLTRVVSLIKGVSRATVDFGTKQLESHFDDDHVSEQKLLREVVSLGYQVV